MDDRKLADAVKKHILTFYEDNPFVQHLGMDVMHIEDGCVKIGLSVEHAYTNFYKIAHGGVLMSLADTAMVAACLSCNKKVVTLDFNMNMIKAVPEGRTLYAMAKIIHNGARTMVASCDLFDGNDQLCATGRGTFFVMADLLT